MYWVYAYLFGLERLNRPRPTYREREMNVPDVVPVSDFLLLNECIYQVDILCFVIWLKRELKNVTPGPWLSPNQPPYSLRTVTPRTARRRPMDNTQNAIVFVCLALWICLYTKLTSTPRIRDAYFSCTFCTFRVVSRTYMVYREANEFAFASAPLFHKRASI